MSRYARICLFALCLSPVLTSHAINPGHGGAWIDADHSGQGVLLEVVPTDHELVAYWFTWTEDGERLWLVGQGPYDGDQADLTVYRAEGGRFLADDPVALTAVGEATVTAPGCSSLRLAYRPTVGAAQTLDLTRLAPAAGCAVAAESGPSEYAVDDRGELVPLAGDWVFDGCTVIDASQSLSHETMRFRKDRLDITMTIHAGTNCVGPGRSQGLSLMLRAAGRASADLDGRSVPVTRFDMAILEAEEIVRQVFYVEATLSGPRLTHGRFAGDDGRTDAAGYPLDLHSVFVRRQP